MPNLVTFAVSVAAISLLFKALYDRGTTFGAFRDPSAIFHNAGAGDLKFIDGINCEDLHYHVGSGQIFAACQGTPGSRGKWFPPLHNFDDPSAGGDGELRVIDTKTFTSRKLSLSGFNSFFNTHGIDIIVDPQQSDAIYIHAVNHAPTSEYAEGKNASLPAERKAASRVEIFHHVLGSDTATHIRTVQHELIRTPNDLLATGPTSFYVTNDHFYREGTMRMVEDLGTRATAAWSNMLHVAANAKKDGYNGVNAVIALTGLHNNNGLGRGPENRIMICDASGGVTYLAHKEGRELKVDEHINYKSTVDNPSWFIDEYPGDNDRSGIVNAGLAKALAMAEAVKHNNAVPSIVWLSSVSPTKGWDTTMLFTDNGLTLSSASAAILVSIDPATTGGKKQAWLFMSGFGSLSVVVTKVDL